jgi:serine/threonine-protein kinase RsbW
VTVEFVLQPRPRPDELIVRVLDEGEGFDPDQVANPLDPENVLKSSGRGIFFMRNFMDDVSIARRPEGGMAVRMSKKLA